MISSNPPPSLYFLRDPPPSTPSTHNDETHPPRSTYLFISWRTDIHAVTLQNDARVKELQPGIPKSIGSVGLRFCCGNFCKNDDRSGDENQYSYVLPFIAQYILIH